MTRPGRTSGPRWNLRWLAGTLTAALASIAAAFVVTADVIGDSRGTAPVVFVCRNGVAMSVWSAAWFNRLAEARGLRERAISRAALPSFREVPPSMAFALALDGFVLDGYRPAVVTRDDASRAELVVAIDVELPLDVEGATHRAERWDGFPPMREQYFASRRALEARVEELVARLEDSALTAPSAVR
jgi:protein-tyrosine-phosphatase